MISGTLAKVFTLFSRVGFPHSPDSVECGGRTLGMPRLPSMEYIRALASPQTKAPAPSTIVDAEAEIAVHDLLAQDTGGLGLLERDAEALHRQRVLVADVDDARDVPMV